MFYVFVHSFKKSTSVFFHFSNAFRIIIMKESECIILHSSFFKHKGAPIIIRLFQKHKPDVVSGILNGKIDWTLAFFKTFYSHNHVRDFISTHITFRRRHDFNSVLKI